MAPLTENSETTLALDRQISALKAIIFTRFDGMDRAIIFFSENIKRVTRDAEKQTDNKNPP